MDQGQSALTHSCLGGSCDIDVWILEILAVALGKGMGLKTKLTVVCCDLINISALNIFLSCFHL